MEKQPTLQLKRTPAFSIPRDSEGLVELSSDGRIAKGARNPGWDYVYRDSHRQPTPCGPIISTSGVTRVTFHILNSSFPGNGSGMSAGVGTALPSQEGSDLIGNAFGVCVLSGFSFTSPFATRSSNQACGNISLRRPGVADPRPIFIDDDDEVTHELGEVTLTIQQGHLLVGRDDDAPRMTETQMTQTRDGVPFRLPNYVRPYFQMGYGGDAIELVEVVHEGLPGTWNTWRLLTLPAGPFFLPLEIAKNIWFFAI